MELENSSNIVREPNLAVEDPVSKRPRRQEDICMESAASSIPSVFPSGIKAADGWDWVEVISNVKSAITAIRVTCARAFEDTSAGVWQGTGFVVSTQDPRASLILTNRHIISTGPIRAFATFDMHEELPVYPVYRDPIHDFGLLQFDATQLRFTPKAEIPLSPSGLRVGVEALVIGNDNAEKIQILPATIGRVDRNCPEYDGGFYVDENTFYAGAGSNTSGGSSGSPVIDKNGCAIALNAGGATEASSAYYLPLDRVVHVLRWLHEHKNDSLPPRGTLLTQFLFQPFDMLRRLGFNAEQENRVLSECKSLSTGQERPSGLLVVEHFLPSSEAEDKLQPGDVLMELNGSLCPDFVTLEDVLDLNVDAEVSLQVSRGGELVDARLQVHDLHALIPHDFVECSNGVFHMLSYHACKRYHLPVQERGIFVAQSGFSLGLELPYHAVISEVNGKLVRCISDFAKALEVVPHGALYEVRWCNPTINERRMKRSFARMENRLWAKSCWKFSAGRPNTWTRSSESMASTVEEEQKSGDMANASQSSRSSAEDLSYPENRDAKIAAVQPMLCAVTSRVAHEFATDFIESKEERNSTLIQRHGVGIVVNTTHGLVVTDRYSCPQPLVHVELTFAQLITVDAVVLFIHPQHNLALLQYDPAAVQSLPVRALDLAGLLGPEPSPEELASGEVLHFVSLHSDHRLSAKRVTVGSVYLKQWEFADPPAYRDRNLEICNLNDSFEGLGGLLVDPENPAGRPRAWFAQFPSGKHRYVAGMPTPVLALLLKSLGLLDQEGPAIPKEVPALDCEFCELSLAKATRDRGMKPEDAKQLAASCQSGRRLALMVHRVTQQGECDGHLMEGDIVVQVEGRYVTRPQEVERAMESQGRDGALWKVLRSGVLTERRVRPSWRCSDGTEHLVVFNGIVLRRTLRAVAERGGPLKGAEKGLYFWYVIAGSPADTFGVPCPGWLAKVDDFPTPTLESLLEILSSGSLSGKEWLRCQIVDIEGRQTVKALQPDAVFWPTVELRRKHHPEAVAGKGRLLHEEWVRTEISI